MNPSAMPITRPAAGRSGTNDEGIVVSSPYAQRDDVVDFARGTIIETYQVVGVGELEWAVRSKDLATGR